jgi:serine/threonine-protein kinase
VREPQPGETFARAYLLERELGRGGMGVVFAARDVRTGQRVALKLLDGAVATPEGRHRFVREARTAAQIRSDHVVRVLDVGEDDGTPFIAMELLEGHDLGVLARQRGVLSAEEAVGYVLQAAWGLASAHAAGVLHRDLKPGNVFVTRRADGFPLVKLVDFGLAKQATGERTLTKSGVALGSPKYMSPEQFRSARDVDPRADVYALGAILYRLLTGRPPHDGDTLEAVLMSILTEPIPPIAAVRSDVPAGLEAIIASCLAPDPLQRPQRAIDVAQALAPFAPAVARAIGVAPAGYAPPARTIPDGGAYPVPALRAPTPAPMSAPMSAPGWGPPSAGPTSFAQPAPASGASSMGGAPAVSAVSTSASAPFPQPAPVAAPAARTPVALAFLAGVGALALLFVAAVVWQVSQAPATAGGSTAIPADFSGRFDPADKIDLARRRAAARYKNVRLLAVNAVVSTADGLVDTRTNDSAQYRFLTDTPGCPVFVTHYGGHMSMEECLTSGAALGAVPDPRCGLRGVARAIAQRKGAGALTSAFYGGSAVGPRWFAETTSGSVMVDATTCAVVGN